MTLRRLLIANRGEIALRIVRAAKAKDEAVRKRYEAESASASKTAFLAKLKNESGEKTDAAAERIVKVMPEWTDYIKRMVNAKTAANRAKVHLNYIEMRGWENRSAEATKRAEMRLT